VGSFTGCEGTGLVEIAAVAVHDGKVAVGPCAQFTVLALLGKVQRLTGRAHAAPQLALIGQGNRLAAVLIAVHLHRTGAIQEGAIGTERQRRVGVVHARLRMGCRRGVNQRRVVGAQRWKILRGDGASKSDE
jgi:hypothetical protein